MHDKSPWALPALLGATEPLGLEFFNRSPVDLARALLGCVLVHRGTAGMIVETEAYLGAGDLAAHSAHGLTDRTKVIFGPPGRAYVYFIYGMYHCLNVVADRDGVPGCALLRALEPLCGLSKMYERRNWKGPPTGLTNGPGKLTRALTIDGRYYGRRLDKGSLTIRRWLNPPAFRVAVTPRIGINACADLPLRFVWADHPSLSRRSVECP